MPKIVKHDEIKDSLGKLVGVLVGVTYTDAVTQQQSYKEVPLLAKEFVGCHIRLKLKKRSGSG